MTAWEMTAPEEAYLRDLPEIVEVWHLRPYGAFEGIFYLTEEQGRDGMRALAYSAVAAVLETMAVRREFIIGIDLERGTAQAALIPRGSSLNTPQILLTLTTEQLRHLTEALDAGWCNVMDYAEFVDVREVLRAVFEEHDPDAEGTGA